MVQCNVECLSKIINHESFPSDANFGKVLYWNFDHQALGALLPLVTAPWRIVSLMTAGGGRVVVEAGAATATAAGQQQDSSWRFFSHRSKKLGGSAVTTFTPKSTVNEVKFILLQTLSYFRHTSLSLNCHHHHISPTNITTGEPNSSKPARCGQLLFLSNFVSSKLWIQPNFLFPRNSGFKSTLVSSQLWFFHLWPSLIDIFTYKNTNTLKY